MVSWCQQAPELGRIQRLGERGLKTMNEKSLLNKLQLSFFSFLY
jgi:hypothetical protein